MYCVPQGPRSQHREVQDHNLCKGIVQDCLLIPKVLTSVVGVVKLTHSEIVVLHPHKLAANGPHWAKTFS